jgi:signal transduction histidine kinase
VPGAGKLAALHESVSAEFDTTHQPSADPVTERAAREISAFAALLSRAAATLEAQAGDIAVRWGEQARTVALRDPSETGGVNEVAVVRTIVGAVAATLVSNRETADGLVALGLGFGTSALTRGRSLAHALKALDLLAAMMLYSVETSLAERSDANAAAGIRLSRRLQQATSLLNLAATKGYTQAMSDAMRERFRHLRHDLRNPLGTIKSVLAMMDDETMPVEARAHPRFRAMAKRNARSLSDLIADRLRDGESLVPALAHQTASLRTIAGGVRRDLRGEAETKTTTVVVGRSPRSSVVLDAVGLELVLHELLLAALHEASAGDELVLEFGEVLDERIAVSLTSMPARQPISNPDALQRVAGVVEWMRGELRLEVHAIVLRLPAHSADRTAAVPEMVSAVPFAAAADAPANESQPPGTPSDSRESGHDVGSASESKHGQPGRL